MQPTSLQEHKIEFVDYVLASKRNKREEFFVNLFEFCNLRCSFCWQDHTSTDGMDRIVENAQKIIGIIDKRSAEGFDINVMGGELFCDEIEDNLFVQYEQFAEIIHQHCQKTSRNVTINWVTNLVYTNVDRVMTLITNLKQKNIDTHITTSYDPTGRFNPTTLKLFLKNLETAKLHVSNISLVLTKPNIKSLLLDTDDTFKFLYQNYRVFVDYYSPEKNAEKMAPSDVELLQIFHFFIDNYPKIGPISDWINNNTNSMTCRSSNVILPSGDTGKCRKLVHKEAYKNFGTEINLHDNKNMEMTFMERNNCLSCEYFHRCGLGCFLQSDFLLRPALPECVFKLSYDYITKGIKRDEFYK